jgi:hypothetical protein
MRTHGAPLLTVRFASILRKPGTLQLDVIENGPAAPSP